MYHAVGHLELPNIDDACMRGLASGRAEQNGGVIDVAPGNSSIFVEYSTFSHPYTPSSATEDTRLRVVFLGLSPS